MRLPPLPQVLRIPQALLPLRLAPRARSFLPAPSACPAHSETVGLHALMHAARVAALNSTGQVQSARLGSGGRHRSRH
ncbi:TPA: hypothetical protein HH295_12010 [Xanthomonas vasicola pv. zeae]|uniref:Uncharacterized protein n=1 Tax=Xanthomonas vasicola pv. vasculorum TaxID=325776 RepID=A0AAE8F8K1_XANVA|nr:hypothetical protein C7V42_02705 [Xanthomonas vasicola pv. vasculorum]KFA22537.1 hypothetical protein KW5_0123470 [Xanthomonas vasicola pv. vasculorum NCPPB 1326]KFA32243.1 hypothetical protein KWG_0108445 [Xanthomonas vasicola pv. vasculorum NCPPB 1381]TWQ11234.1 hypothetical protein FQK02_02690 [Xanthomonas vasicola]HHZ22639.1 hypothetical protein [Xanthomonas vasicola pv. zeae]